MSKKFQKVVSITTSLTTMLWMSGVATLAPMAASAATIVDGDTIRVSGGIDVYIVKLVGAKKFKRLVLNPQVFNSYGHLSWSKVISVSQAESDAYTTSNLVRVINDTKVYKLTPDGDVGTKQWLNMTGDAFSAAGYDWDSIYTINATDGGNYTAGSDITSGSVSVPSTGLSVSLASDNPAATAVAIGANDLIVQKINFTAGADSAKTVDGLSITRSGIANDSDVAAIKLYDGSQQLGSTQAINTNTHKASFSSLGFVVPAGMTKTITVKINVSTSAATSSSIIVGIASASDITITGVTPNGSFPVNSNALTVAGVVVGGATISALTSPSGTLISGTTDQYVSAFRISASSSEGLTVKSIKLTETGTSVDSDISNIKLKVSGAQVGSTVSSLSNGTATFDLSSAPISILAGGNKQIDVYVDIAGGINTSRTIIFSIDNVNNVTLIGANSGGGIAAQNVFPQTATGVTVGQGTLSTALDATNPSAATFVKGTTDNSVLALKFSAGSNEGARITELKLTLTGSATDISNVSLYKDGAKIAGPQAIVGSTVTFGSNTSGAFDSTGLFDVAASTNVVITVKADIPTGATANNTVLLAVAAAGDVKADGLSSRNDIAAASVTGTATGNSMTISAKGTMSITLSSSSASAQTVAKGATNVSFGKYNLSGASEPMTVSALTIRAYAGSGTGTVASSTSMTNVRLYDSNGNQLGSACSAPDSTNGTCAYSFTLAVAKNETKVIEVKADVPTGAANVALHVDIPGGGTIATDITTTGSSSGADITETGSATGNSMTVGSPSLTVAAASTPVASTFVVSTQGAHVLSLLLTASNSEDLTVSSIKLLGSTSTSLNGAGNTVAGSTTTSLKLYDGTSQIGITKAWTAGSAAGDDYVTFDSLNLTVSKGTTKQIDFKLNVGGSSVAHYFGVSTTADVVAVGKSSASTATISLSTTPAVSKAMTFGSSGSLAVTAAADSPNKAIVSVGGQGVGLSGVSLLKVKFTATNEPIALTNLTFTSDQGDRDGTNYSRVYLYNGTSQIGSTYPIATTTGGNSSAVFNLTSTGNEVTVPKNGDLTLTIKGDLNGVGDGSTSGTSTNWGIAYSTDVVGRGVDSNVTTIYGDSSIATNVDRTAAARLMTVRKSKPTIATVAVSGSVGGLTAGNKTLYKFSVTADSKADLEWNKVMFAITGSLNAKGLGTDDDSTRLADSSISGIYYVNSGSTTADALAANNFKMYSTDSGSQITNGTFFYRTYRNEGNAGNNRAGQAGGWYVAFVKTAASSAEVVAAGSTKTYELRADVVGTLGASGNSIVTNIPSIGKYSGVTTSSYEPLTRTGLGAAGTVFTYDSTTATTTIEIGSTSTPSFIWSDKSASSHATSTSDWTDDYLVSGIPTDSVIWSL